MKHKLNSVEKITNNNWLNLYKANYETGPYFFASRRKQNHLDLINQNSTADAVRIIPYIKKDEKIYIAFIKEFRRALGKYIYGLPAGLIDNVEKPEESAKRELYEEIGATTLSIKNLGGNLYTSAGLTDEKLTLFSAEVKLNNCQKLEANEDIEIFLVELSQVPSFLTKNEFCLSSYLMALAFYYENYKSI